MGTFTFCEFGRYGSPGTSGPPPVADASSFIQTQTITTTSTGSTQATLAFNQGTTVIKYKGSADQAFLTGSNPTAATTDIQADAEDGWEYMGVKAGNKLAAIDR